MENYRLIANGKKWNDRDESIEVKASSPEQAITKARILKGEDFYRRLYYVAVIVHKSLFGDDLWEIADLCSYGMFQEQMRRDYGVVDGMRRVYAR